MSLFKRAMLYVTRKGLRSILFLAIVAAMVMLALSGLTIKNHADRAADELRRSIGSSFILEIRYDTEDPDVWEQVELGEGKTVQQYIGPAITGDMLDRVMAIDGVDDCYLYSDYLLYSDDLRLRPAMHADIYAEDLEYYNMPGNPYHIPESRLIENKMRMGVTSYIVSNKSELHPHFRIGAFEIVQGRHIREDDRFAALISEDMAERNALEPGDTFAVEIKRGTLEATDSPMETLGKPMELEVVGIFKMNFQRNAEEYWNDAEYMLPENYVFSDMALSGAAAGYMARVLGTDMGDEKYGRLTFFVGDPRSLNAVIEQVRAIDVDWRYFTLKPDDVAYRTSVRPLEEISGFSGFLSAASLLGCIIVLYLIVSMWTKSRKREMGVFISIGVRRSALLCQLLLECAVVAAAAFLLAFLSSGYVVNAMGNVLESVTAPKATEQLFAVTVNAMLEVEIEKVSTQAVHLVYEASIAGMAAVALGALAVVLAAVWLAARPILKMKPKDILSSY